MSKEKLLTDKNSSEKKNGQNSLLLPQKVTAENKISTTEKSSVKKGPIYHYATVTEAINELKQRGFTLDFNLEENCIVCGLEKFYADEFEIKEIYRYEGNSDPADEAAVYGIESKSGKKGILVTGYGISTDSISTAMLNKLSMRKTIPAEIKKSKGVF